MDIHSLSCYLSYQMVSLRVSSVKNKKKFEDPGYEQGGNHATYVPGLFLSRQGKFNIRRLLLIGDLVTPNQPGVSSYCKRFILEKQKTMFNVTGYNPIGV